MPDPSKIKSFLKSLPIFSQVEDEALDWFIQKSSCSEHPAGEMLFKPGDPADDLIIIVEGCLDVYREVPQGRQDMFLHERGTVTGNLPFSRTQGITVWGKVVEDLVVLRLHRSHFLEMVGVSYKLTQALVGVMSDRIRNISQDQSHDEKLKALGKISAGLAHELNNPASAMVRSAETLYQKIGQTPENFKAVMKLNVTEEQVDWVNDLIFKKIENRKADPKDLSLLDRQDRLEELTDWLEDHSVEDAEDIAETLTEFDFLEDDLEALLDQLEFEEKLTPTLRWFDNRLSTELLLTDIREASHRIADLVHSVKKYSHMDQGVGKTMTDIHDGIRTTVHILIHRFKEKQIEIDKQFMEDLPQVMANPGEMNQVWTNLIANALDALQKGGKITIRTFVDRDYVCIAVEDNGPGIPKEIANRIWEPFFTTKEVGVGTGIGLDMVKRIVERHRGNINLSSEPGKTVFTVRLLVS